MQSNIIKRQFTFRNDLEDDSDCSGENVGLRGVEAVRGHRWGVVVRVAGEEGFWRE